MKPHNVGLQLRRANSIQSEGTGYLRSMLSRVSCKALLDFALLGIHFFPILRLLNITGDIKHTFIINIGEQSTC
jgi:hypothetical protein